jgi:ABC-type multidrug transport system fused ATPase/permease subunit
MELTVIVNLPETFNPFIIFTAYAITAQLQGKSGPSVSQAITSLAALNLLSVPLATLLYAIPQGWAALGCFERIQEFLLQPSRTEQRVFPHVEATNTESASQMKQMAWTGPSRVNVSAGSFAWSDSSSQVIKIDLPLELDSGLTLLIGPVGSGKSTLLKGILGETPKGSSRVIISTPQVAYVDQSAWVMNGSIRDNIVARTDSEFDAEWYTAICQACVLDVDFRQMPHGDSTLVGSRGVKISGGQRQRISIARALYSRKKLAVFDDVLAGLDPVTEEVVFQRVFGRDGLLRKIGTTVLLATHSVKRLPQADFILVLDKNGTLIHQGTFAELNATAPYIHDLELSLEDISSHVDNPANDRSLGEVQAAVSGTIIDANESRKIGDWAIYKYYARALGPLGLVLFGSFVACTSALNGLSSKSSQSIWESGAN